MNTRRAAYVLLAFVTYAAMAAKLVRGIPSHAQSEPAAPAMPALAAIPGVPSMPAVPAVPAVPSAPFGSFWSENGHEANWSSNHGDGPATDCSDLHVRLHNQNPEMQMEERTMTKAEAQVLRVGELENGGVQMRGWDQDTYSVTACKFAIGSDSERQNLLSQTKLAIQSGQVSVSGPGHHDDWTVFLLIRTPRAAEVEVTGHNGPMAFYGVDGKITARASNGPIDIENCSGEADISAVNGPISFSGAGGKLRLHTENGPISVSLDAPSWKGESLVADAVNGPLTLHVPSGFQSSFSVQSSDHTPMSCEASVCSQARKTWDDEHRRIEYGSGAPVIRLSTQNGPVSVETL